MTVEELEERMTFAEFNEWLAYRNIKLRQFEKQDYYLAQICTVLNNCWSKPAKKIKDFLLKFNIDGEDDFPDHKTLKNKLLVWAQLNNAMVRKRNGLQSRDIDS